MSENIQTQTIQNNTENVQKSNSPQKSLLGSHPNSLLKSQSTSTKKPSGYYNKRNQPGTDMVLDGRFLVAKNDKYGKLTFYFAIENQADVKRINLFMDKHKNNPEYKYPFWLSQKDNTMMLTVKGTNTLVKEYPSMKGQETYRMTVCLKPYVFNEYSGFSASVTDIII